MLIFLDVDGTLAIPGQPPSTETVEAIRVARSRGHKVFLSTGRPEKVVPEPIHTIGFDGGIYCAGGRVLVNGRLIYDRPMAPDRTVHLIKTVESLDMGYILECEEKSFARPLTAAPSFGTWPDIGEYRGEPLYKLVFLASSREQIDGLTRQLDERYKVVCFDNLPKEYHVIVGEVSDPAVNKGHALRLLCEYLHAAPDECVAFGDSMNDAEIMQAAGTGIAMGNCVEELRVLADRMCESCEDNGVAKELRRMGLA